VLRGRVGTVVAARAQPFGRRDVDDATQAVAREMRQAGADEPLVRGEVDGERRRPRRFEGVAIAGDERGDRDARVVHEDVDRAEPLDDRIDHLGDRIRIGDVERPPGGSALAMHRPDLVDDRFGAGGKIFARQFSPFHARRRRENYHPSLVHSLEPHKTMRMFVA